MTNRKYGTAPYQTVVFSNMLHTNFNFTIMLIQTNNPGRQASLTLDSGVRLSDNRQR